MLTLLLPAAFAIAPHAFVMQDAECFWLLCHAHLWRLLLYYAIVAVKPLASMLI